MSLETAILENTTALNALLAATKDLLSFRTDAVEKVAAAVAASTGKGAATKDKPKTDTAATGNGNISTNPEDRKENPYEGIKELIAGYLGEIDRPEEREARKEKVKALLAHEKIKKPDVAEAKSAEHIMESAIPLFKEQIAKLTAKGALTEPAKKADDDLI